MREKILDRAFGVGLEDEKYRFLFGPEGFVITNRDLEELRRLARAAVVFMNDADRWYREAVTGGNSHWSSILGRQIPKKYLPLAVRPGLPRTLMVDTVWTEAGWRIVELDATNRNGLGYPMVLRHLYNLPNIWKGNDAEWREAGLGGAVQVMMNYHRYYEPYYRHFLAALGGTLIRELEADGEEECEVITRAPAVLDVPVFMRQGEFLSALLERAAEVPVGIPPKHHLASKAVQALPWEEEQFPVNGIGEFLAVTRLLRNGTELPVGTDFFVKLFQSGGAHGTFRNDIAKLEELRSRRPQAIWQEAWPIARRRIKYLEDGGLVEAQKFIRLSIYVNPEGEIVDADVTASDQNIVHGGRQSVMTVPVLT